MSTLSKRDQEIRFITFKSKLSKATRPIKLSSVALLSKMLPYRKAVIDWIYLAQKTLLFSKSSLFLGIALLDKLIINGIPLKDFSCQLLGGTLTLLITKFNEVYPVTIRKLQAISTENIELEQYIQTQEAVLETLSFDLSPEEAVYQNLAELEFKLGEHSEQIIKTAICNPAVAFKHGQESLIAAVGSMLDDVLDETKNDNTLTKHSAELRTQLQRLCSL